MSKTFITEVISDGRITIPKEIREGMRIEDGDHIELEILRVIRPKKEA